MEKVCKTKVGHSSIYLFITAHCESMCKSPLRACLFRAEESKWLPAFMEQVERKALNFRVWELGTALVMELQGMKDHTGLISSCFSEAASKAHTVK